MFTIFKPVFASPVTNFRLLSATLLIHILALAPTFYVTLVFVRYVGHGLDATLITLTAGALLAMALESGLRRVRFRMISALCAREDRLRGERLAACLLNGRLDQLGAIDPARRLMAQRALEQIQQALTPATVLGWLDAPFALLFWLVLMFMAWQLGVASAVIAVGTLCYLIYHTLSLRLITQRQQKAQQAQQPVMMSLDRIESVRAANAGQLLAKRWARRSGEARLQRFAAAHLQDQIQQAIQTASALLSVVVIGFGARLATAGEMDVGALFGASILAVRMLALIARPAQQITQLLQAQQAMETLSPLLDIPLELSEGTRLNHFEGRIELKDVSFHYPEGKGPLFESCNVVIPAGTLVLVTGSNSTGKTTFTRLLAGLLSPVRGSVLADGVDLRQFVPRWWRRQLVYVPQEPEFFDGTLRENLTTLAPKLSPDALQLLVSDCGLRGFVDQHPRGLDSPITQGGRTLSPGIRRRIALARAMTTAGKLVIMDEPAEGLDREGMQMLNELLNRIRAEGRTLFYCTQTPADELARLALVINLDSKPVPRITYPVAMIGAPS